MNKRAFALLLCLLLIVFGTYFVFRFRGFVIGPQITILEPEEGALLASPRVTVRGTGKDAARLELDGRPIYVDESGAFEEALLLAPGLNIIELKAEGRFGRTLREQKMVMVRQSE
ncbi:MAG: hypothetical protein HYS44_03435 [Candidatus Niyogibacteria bacterium]|nr:hypothetical protein [Candidatus Niyogibacteria bacterium]